MLIDVNQTISEKKNEFEILYENKSIYTATLSFINIIGSFNLENLRKMAPEGTSQKIAMLLEQGVPDPWFTGDFQETYQLVKTGCQRLLDEIV